MNAGRRWTFSRSPSARAARVIVVVLGVLALQSVIYGPSMLGLKILLPLDILTMRGYYGAAVPGQLQPAPPRNPGLSDLVLFWEPNRLFAAEEVRAGRVPLWRPEEFAGAPFVAYAKYSPINALNYLFPSPVTIAWVHVLTALVAGLGGYFFFRDAMKASFWPAAVGGWCYPLTLYFVLWDGYGTASPVAWLPWMLAAIDRCIRKPAGWAGPALGLLTGVMLVSGAGDVECLVLLAAGVYAAGAVICEFVRRRRRRPAALALAALAAALLCGLALAMPYLAPLVDYSMTGARMQARHSGREERPPVGLESLPAAVAPWVDGTNTEGSIRIVSGNLRESSSATYAGLIAALLAAPLALARRRRRPRLIVLAALGVLGIAWCANIPGLVWLYRLRPLNMLSYNRFTFATALALLAMAVVGVDTLRRGPLRRPVRWLLPALAPAALVVYCVYRIFVLPEPVATYLKNLILTGHTVYTSASPDIIAAIQSSFRQNYLITATLAGAALAGWVLLSLRRFPAHRLGPAVLAVMAIDLLIHAWGVNSQCDPALYYPPIDVLQQAAGAEPGRVVGVDCLPANLLETAGLSDIRGYDAVDPARYVKLLDLCRSKALPQTTPRYAILEYYFPSFRKVNDSLLLPPIMDMLNLRYLVFNNPPDPALRARFVGAQFCVMENPRALPRAFVPQAAVALADAQQPAALMRPGFDPRRTAYVDAPLDLPAAIRGRARIVRENPQNVVVEADMETPGLLVLADRWDPGWRATVDGRPAPILPANYILRGVVVPQGKSVVEFVYDPPSFRLGVRLMLLGAGILAAWALLVGVVGACAKSSSGPR